MLGVGYSKEPRLIEVISLNIDNNIDSNQTPGCGSNGRIEIERIASTQLEGWYCLETCLVESTKGDLLMVQSNSRDRTRDRTYTN